MLVVAGLVLAGVVGVYAADAAKAAPAKKECCSQKYVAKIMDLQGGQKATIEAAQADCVKAGCTKKSSEACIKAIEAVLNPDQLKIFKAAMDADKAAKKDAKKDAAKAAPAAK